MPPRCAAQDISHGLPRHADAIGDALMGPPLRSQGANLAHCRFGETGSVASLSPRVALAVRTLAALPEGVLNVVRARAGKQVVGADARRIVAAVAEVKSGQDAPIGQLIRGAMGFPDTPIVQTHRPISAATRPRPFPARPDLRTVRRGWPVLVHLRPEAFRKGHAASGVVARLGAIIAAVLQAGNQHSKWLPAFLARAVDTLQHLACRVAGAPAELARLARFGVEDCAALLAGVSMAGHSEPPLQVRGVMPRRGVSGRSGAFCCLNYTIGEHKMAASITIPAS
jgi:hypothetical protein